MCLIQRGAQTVQFIVYLLIAIDRNHHLFLIFCLDLIISDEVIFYQRIADEMRKIMGL